MSHARLNEMSVSVELLVEAKKSCVDQDEARQRIERVLQGIDQNVAVNSTLRSIRISLPLCFLQLLKSSDLISYDFGSIFRPPKEKVNASIKDHNFLGRAKVGFSD
jgi:hypothetical protein